MESSRLIVALRIRLLLVTSFYGGIARLNVNIFPDNVPCRVKVYAIWANKNPDIDLYNFLNASLQTVEWDPSVEGDFTTKFGKILYMKQATINPSQNFEIVHRFKPQKIDQAVYTGEPPVLLSAAC